MSRARRKAAYRKRRWERQEKLRVALSNLRRINGWNMHEYIHYAIQDWGLDHDKAMEWYNRDIWEAAGWTMMQIATHLQKYLSAAWKLAK